MVAHCKQEAQSLAAVKEMVNTLHHTLLAHASRLSKIEAPVYQSILNQDTIGKLRYLAEKLGQQATGRYTIPQRDAKELSDLLKDITGELATGDES